MDPFPLRTARLTLNQPGPSDIDDVAAYCTDPLFERFMVTPWPYERQHAEGFVADFVPRGWASGKEWTWAVREAADTPLVGMISIRLDSGIVGYWLGAPHRGRGLMPEALTVVVDAVFDRSRRDEVYWECVAGNVASARVAQKAGFRFIGHGPSRVPARDGSPYDAWTGVLHRDDSRKPKPGWPDLEMTPENRRDCGRTQ